MFLVDWLQGRGQLGRCYVDPGTWTDSQKRQSGRPYSVGDYAAWVSSQRAKGIHFDRFLSLNILGENDLTLSNLQSLVDLGYDPVPVWQPGMNGAEVAFLYTCAGPSELVAMGGARQRGWVHTIRVALRSFWPAYRDGSHVHILGLSDTTTLAEWRPRSADASSWAAGLRFGHLKSYAPGSLSMGTKVKNGDPLNDASLAFIDLLEVPRDLLHPGAWVVEKRVSLVALLTLAAHLLFVAEIEKSFGTRVFLSFQAGLYDLLNHPFNVLGRVDRLLGA